MLPTLNVPPILSLADMVQALQAQTTVLGQLVDGLTNGTLTLEMRAPTSSGFVADQISVATTPTLLAAANANRRSLRITNPSGGQDIFIGGAAVTSSDGYLIATGALEWIMEDSVSTAAIYACTASSTATVSVLEW